MCSVCWIFTIFVLSKLLVCTILIYNKAYDTLKNLTITEKHTWV